MGIKAPKRQPMSLRSKRRKQQQQQTTELSPLSDHDDTLFDHKIQPIYIDTTSNQAAAFDCFTCNRTYKSQDLAKEVTIGKFIHKFCTRCFHAGGLISFKSTVDQL